MPESAGQKRGCPWLRVVGITLVLLGLSVTSASAAIVTAPPTIPLPSADATVTATTGAWTPVSATPRYEWFRCDAQGANCAPISDVCGRRYLIQPADLGNSLRVRLTVTDPNGPTAQALSDHRPISAYIEPNQQSNTCVQVTPNGAGQGAFNSGTPVGAGAEPAPDTSLPFIDPFPVIRISGRFQGRRTKLTRVTVKAPRGAGVRINCNGRGCPYKRKAFAVRFIRLRQLQRTYRPKATIEIRVTQPQKIGKYTRLRTRRNKAPVRLDRCLMPDKTRPVACPQG